MQPTWFTVPWVQFQSLPNFTTNLTGLGQLTNPAAAPPPSHHQHAAAAGMGNMGNMGSMGAMSAQMNGANSVNVSAINGINGLNTVSAISGMNGFNGLSSVNTINSLGLNGLSGTISGINGLNGLSSLPTVAGHGGMVAIPAPTGQCHPTLALQQVLRRPHQPVPPPLAALIRAKKDVELSSGIRREKRKAEDEFMENSDIKKAKLETKALKAKRPGFSEERYNETSYYIENGLRKVYPYYFTFTTFTKGRWVGEKILDVFAKEFRAHPAEEYERCIKSGTLTVNYEKVDTDYRLKHNDLLANIVHRHETPVLSRNIEILHLDEDLVVLDKPCSLPVHPCGRYRHNTVVFILAKEYNLKNLRTIHRLDRLTSGLLLFGRTPKKAREMEQQIRTRQVTKEYVCRVEGEFPRESIECNEPIEVVSYKIGVCKVSPTGKECRTEFQRLSYNGKTSVVLCRPHTGRMHQIRVHLQYLGFPIVNDPLYNHMVFGPKKGKGGIVGKTDEQLIQDLIKIHNAENWLGMDGDAEYSMFKGRNDKTDNDEEGGSQRNTPSPKEKSPLRLESPRVTSPPALIASVGFPTIKHNVTHPSAMHSMMTHNTHVSPKAFNGCNSGIIGDNTMTAATTQTNNGVKDYNYQPNLMTVDEHCYECKVRYRDPKPKDLVMYLHALKYCGPGWQYETKLPEWANEGWIDMEENH